MFAIISVIVAFFVFSVYAYYKGALKTTEWWSDSERTRLMYTVQQLMMLKGYKILKRKSLPAIIYAYSPTLDGAVGAYSGSYNSWLHLIKIGALQSGVATLGHELTHWCQPELNAPGYTPAYTQEKDKAKARALYKADRHEIEARRIQGMLMVAAALGFDPAKILTVSKKGRATIKAWEDMPWDETRSVMKTAFGGRLM